MVRTALTGSANRLGLTSSAGSDPSLPFSSNSRDDSVCVDAIVSIEVLQGPGLSEALDAERLDAVSVHAAEPAESRWVTV